MQMGLPWVLNLEVGWQLHMKQKLMEKWGLEEGEITSGHGDIKGFFRGNATCKGR